MCDFYINHLHFRVGNRYGEFSVLTTEEAIDEYSLANFGRFPISQIEKISAVGVMTMKTIKYALNNNWRKMHKLPMLKRRARKLDV